MLGTVVLVLGIIAIPYPGPGWLIVFAGLGILATEFTWAGRLLRFARRYYDRWVAWVRRQNKVVQLLLALATWPSSWRRCGCSARSGSSPSSSASSTGPGCRARSWGELGSVDAAGD